MKLNLGCGNKILEGYINLDIRDYGQEIKRDVLQGLPFDDNKFDEILADNFLEHIQAGQPLFFVISEIWRALKPKGKVLIRVPHSETPQAFFADHHSFWNEAMVTALFEDEYQSYGIFKKFTVEECVRGRAYGNMFLWVRLEAIKND